MLRSVVLGSALMLSWAASANADDKLPKSGSFKTHNTNSPDNHLGKFTDTRSVGSGTLWTVHFNDAGSGLLHLATQFCAYLFDYENGAWTDEGRCVSTDADGDKIFRVFKGKGVDKEGNDVDVERGDGTLTGGTGKFAGIQGTATYYCKEVHSSPEINACSEVWNYKFP